MILYSEALYLYIHSIVHDKVLKYSSMFQYVMPSKISTYTVNFRLACTVEPFYAILSFDLLMIPYIMMHGIFKFFT